ncbi:MAG: diphthine--ammonia ligase [bacterium]
MKAFVSWSGGKESNLACYRAMQNQEIEVSYLLNMTSEDGSRSRSHGISSDLLRKQAEAIGIPIIQPYVNWEGYEAEFKKALANLKEKGVSCGVFGDIDVLEHRDWVERVCNDMGIKPILPLWKNEREKLMLEFIRVGFKAIIVACNPNFLGIEWLGREINEGFINDLKALPIDLCGENGEFHTFVYDGPIFKNPIEFIKGKKALEDKRLLLEVKLK